MPPPWNEMLPSSVIPSFCHSVSIYFPIIIWTTIAHIQLEINIWMYLINIRATNEFSFDSMIFDEVMPLKIWKKWESTFKRFFFKKNHCLYLTQFTIWIYLIDLRAGLEFGTGQFWTWFQSDYFLQSYAYCLKKRVILMDS